MASGARSRSSSSNATPGLIGSNGRKRVRPDGEDIASSPDEDRCRAVLLAEAALLLARRCQPVGLAAQGNYLL
jgi:hypothetical protein